MGNPVEVVECYSTFNGVTFIGWSLPGAGWMACTLGRVVAWGYLCQLSGCGVLGNYTVAEVGLWS